MTLPDRSARATTTPHATRAPRAAAPLAGALLGFLLVLPSCKSSVATAAECDQVAAHLAELQVQKEKRPPLGRLATAPFNTKENEAAIRDEAEGSARARCKKGWKRSVFDCMSEAKTIEAADKCRFE